MDEGINNILMDELMEAHTDFNNIIQSMKDNSINYRYDEVINMEKNSYTISYNSLTRMNKSLDEYKYFKKNNIDFFDGEIKIYTKYILLYIVSIIMIKVFAKTLSAEKINEIWYALVGIVLGTANAKIINKNINNYRYGNKQNRLLMDDLYTLKEDYDANFEIARKEISYIFSLNRNLKKELLNIKLYVKK